VSSTPIRLARGLAFIAVPALLLVSADAGAAQSVPGVDNVTWQANVAYTADALRAFNDMSARWSAAWKDGDAKRVADLYSVAAAVAYSGDQSVRGRDAVLRLLTERLRRGTDVRLAVTDFVSSGDIMSAWGPFVIEGAGTELVTGTYSMTLRMENARWRIRSQVFTPAIPLAPAASAGSGTEADSAVVAPAP
jgi:ketosteroid isomerase-like protein